MNYTEFLEQKQKSIIDSGFDISETELNPMLFDFQKYIVKTALKKGKYAVFADTGLGKTFIQLEWAKHVNIKTEKPVLILAPLAVSGQTIDEGRKFGIEIKKYDGSNFGIQISNYEQLENINTKLFSGIVLDESSILKNFDGKTKQKIIKTFAKTPYKLACTATPSPNDPMELGNHSEFLDAMKFYEMLAMYFVHDAQSTQKWRLKGHAVQKFYDFVSSWGVMLMKPTDIGFTAKGYDLPELKIKGVQIQTEVPEGMLFGGLAVNATDYNRSLRETEPLRINEVLRIVKKIGKQPLIIWTKQNQEAKNIFKNLVELGYDCRNVQGSDNSEKKERDLLGFGKNEYQILITKAQMAQFGLNYQNCNNQIFTSVDFSFESTYQAIRRSYRFGQTKPVNVWLITTDRMINVLKAQETKQTQFREMQTKMTESVNRNINKLIKNTDMINEDVITENYTLLKGDCVQRIKKIPDNSIDLMVFSPPFADLYTYSNHVEDMGNVADYDEFVQHFKFLATELKRTIKPGRIIAIHCMDLPTLKSKNGYIGIRRFSSMIGDIFESLDMFLHSEFTIWKDPLLAAVRTKTIGLAHKQVTKDMSIIRAGLPDRVLCFKTKEENETPIQLDDIKFTYYIPMHQHDNFPTSPEGFNEFWGFDPESSYDRLTQYSHQVWQRYASPIWMDINQCNTLQASPARDTDDEKHICPLQLEVIERLILLYSNKGETVLDPFGGIGSTGYKAIKMGRKSISIELKESYFNLNKRNHNIATQLKGQLVLL